MRPVYVVFVLYTCDNCVSMSCVGMLYMRCMICICILNIPTVHRWKVDELLLEPVYGRVTDDRHQPPPSAHV